MADVELYGTGSSVTSQTRTFLTAGLVPDNGTTINTFGNTSVYISNYTSGVAKSTSSDSVSEANATFAVQSIHAGSWTGTDPVTSVKLLMNGGNFVQYSTASLYKITAD